MMARIPILLGLLLLLPAAAQDFRVAFPPVNMDEDAVWRIDVDSTVTGSPVPLDQLDWQFDCGPNLQLDFDPTIRRLAIRSAQPDWFGVNDVCAVATTPDQARAADTFRVTIRMVNDPPVTTLQQLQVSGDPDSNIVDLKPWVRDVDHLPWQLNWEFWGYTQFTIEWENRSGNIIRIVPLSGAAVESGFFRVYDPDGGADTARVTISSDGAVATPISIAIAGQSVAEDSVRTLNLDDYVTIDNATPDQVSWAFSAEPELALNYDDLQRRLTIAVTQADWHGESGFTAIATAPDGSTAEDTVAVTVVPVNDPPRLLLRSLSLSRDPDSNVVDLKRYAADVDHGDRELTWQFSGFADYAIEWLDATEKIIRIVPSAGAGTDSGMVTVRDPAGAEGGGTVTFAIRGGSLFDVAIPPLSFPEDDSVSLFLDTCLVLSDYLPSAIDWVFESDLLLAAYDPSKRRLRLRAPADWHGTADLVAAATAPDGAVRRDTASVTVGPVNDAPVLSLPTLFVNPQSANRYDLADWTRDVDDSSDVLRWTWGGFATFAIEPLDGGGEVTIAALPGADSESGWFAVRDDDGAADSQAVTITYLADNTPPRLSLPATLTLAEDTVAILDLRQVVVDSTNTLAELSWAFLPGPRLSGSLDVAAGVYRLTPERDWFGQTTLQVTVTDPFGLSDRATLAVTVENRNDFQRVAFLPVDRTAMAIAVTTELPSRVWLDYRLGDGGVERRGSDVFQPEHRFELSGLAPDAVYTVSIGAIDPSGREIAIRDSSFRSGALVVAGDAAIVYPNPLYLSEGDGALRVANLPAGSYRLQVFSPLGERLAELPFDAGGAAPARVALEGPLASGLYLYLLRGPDGGVVTRGKLAVVR